MVKRVVLLYLIFLGVFCCACRGKDADNQLFTSSRKPVIFRMFNAESQPFVWNQKNPVARKIIAETGVRLEMEYAQGNADDIMKIMLADQSYPDIMYTKGAQDEFIEAGVFLPLDDLIEQHGPNIKKFFGENLTNLRYTLEDPSIYFLGSSPVVNENPEPQCGFFLQLGLLKELGYPSIRSVGDFENAILKYKTLHPVVNGQPTIGVSMIADDWRFLISITNPAFLTTGAPDDGEWYIDPQTFQASLHIRRPVEREYFRWLNHIHTIGLLDPETFIQTYPQYLAKIESGRVLGLIDARWDFQNTESKLRARGQAGYTYGIFPVTLQEDFLQTEYYPAAYTSRWGISITDRCSDPVAAIKFFDFLLSEEGQILVHWGIEGLHYQVDDAGRRYFTQQQVELRNLPDVQGVTGINMFGYPFPEYGGGIYDSGGNPYVPPGRDVESDEYLALEVEVREAYGVKYWSELFPPKESFQVRPYGWAWQWELAEQSAEKLIFQKCEDIIRKYITKAVLSFPSDFDRVYDQMLLALEQAGVEKLEQVFTQRIQDVIELYND